MGVLPHPELVVVPVDFGGALASFRLTCRGLLYEKILEVRWVPVTWRKLAEEVPGPSPRLHPRLEVVEELCVG